MEEDNLDLSRPFSLDTSVGRTGGNERNDVAKIETLLGESGHLDLSKTDGPTGFFGTRVDDAVKGFQKDHALKVDGLVNPGGQTIRMLAASLQKMGRRGDTLLAHISPAEASLLKERGGAGTVNPNTGLMEFYDADKMEGEYIWRTVGDGRVRSSHAERNGKVFSWEDPPEDGHPGEAYNCRCWAEDIEKEEPKKDCEEIRWEVWVANRRINALHEQIEAAKYDVSKTIELLGDLKSLLEETRAALRIALIPSVPKFPPSIGDAARAESQRRKILELQQRLEEIGNEIKTENDTLARQKKELEQLEHKQESHRQTAEELSRRYEECVKRQ